MHLYEKQKDSTLIFDGRIIEVREDTAELEDGSLAKREVVKHSGGVCVLPLTEDNEILFVRQFRYPHSKVLLEIPAGKLNYGEDHYACAVRELSEETGMTARHWQKLTCLETTPGFCNERIHIYLATGLRQGETHPDEDEFVATTRMPLKDAVANVMNGTFRDGKTALAIMMAAALKGVSTHSND